MAEIKVCDICIIGAGPAGMTAAIYAGRAGKKTVIVDRDGFGGLIAKSPRVENIPGFASVSGLDFATGMYEQMTALEGVEHIVGEAVLVQYYHGLFIISLSDKTVIQAKSAIFATGTKPRELGLGTKDVYYCVTCDGPFFKGKDVMVIGSGNTGATYALELANYCRRVYMCDVAMDMLCEPILADRVKACDKITFLPNCTVKSVKADPSGALQAVTLTTNEPIKIKAVFSAAGMLPQNGIAAGYAELDGNGYISSMKVPGAFAAGDCLSKSIRQVTTACADGTVAAISAIAYLDSQKR